MAEASVGRALRDGSLEGEHAAALSLKDYLSCPFGAPLFSHFLRGLAANVSAGRSAARGLVLVAFDRSPSFYVDFLQCGGSNCLDSAAKWFRVLDCYSDPLGWKKHRCPSFLQGDGNASLEELRTVFRDVKDLNKLCSLVLDLGRGMVGEGKARFAIAIDSISTLLRHASLPSVASLISNLRAHSQVSTICWLIHSDLHEPRVCAALDYLSTMVAILEQRIENFSGEIGVLSIQRNFYGGRFHLRLKRRNGRVKILYEDFHVEQGGIKFSELSSENKLVNQTLLPKLQFNLQLSEKERIDRANVVLPFEHQGNGETIHIYDGRGSQGEAQTDPHPTTLPAPGISDVSKNMTGGKGEIHYIRDSDDEMPDSDEDPDDDLDI